MQKYDQFDPAWRARCGLAGIGSSSDRGNNVIVERGFWDLNSAGAAGPCRRLLEIYADYCRTECAQRRDPLPLDAWLRQFE